MAADKAPFAPLLGIVAAQLNVTPAVWDLYAARDETRRGHAAELFARLELKGFGRARLRVMLE